MNKTCYKCKVDKDIELFGKKASENDGHQPMCRECRSKHDNLHRPNIGGKKPKIKVIKEIIEPKTRGVKAGIKRGPYKKRQRAEAVCDIAPRYQEKKEYVPSFKTLSEEVNVEPLMLTHLKSVSDNLLARLDRLEEIVKQIIKQINQ